MGTVPAVPGKTFVQRFADCIERQEGATQNNNPGNIWDGLAPPAKTVRIWPHLPIDSRGMIIYPSLVMGRLALEHDVALKIKHGMSLRAAITMYCPPSDPRNNTEAYIEHVSAWMGFDGIEYDIPMDLIESLETSGAIKLRAAA